MVLCKSCLFCDDCDLKNVSYLFRKIEKEFILRTKSEVVEMESGYIVEMFHV